MTAAAPFFEKFVDIRKNEVRRVLLMSTYLLLIIASYSTAKAVRDSLFVTKIGPSQLPYVYLLIAGAMGLVSLVYSRAVNRIGLHRLIRTTSLIAISNLLMFWLLFRNDSPVWFYVLYVWASLFGAITASQFWLLATHVFDPREARRLFAWVGVGGILGGILGGGLTNRMAHWLGTESLLILCAGMMAGTIALLEKVGVRDHPGAARVPSSRGGDSSSPATGTALFRQVRESRHLTMMVLLLSVAVIVEAFIDYEYKFVAKQSITSKDQLTAFFGSITFYIGLFSLLFQMLVSNRILKRFGVGWAILLLPAGLLGAFIALSVKPVLWAAALLQLIDGGFSYSIHRAGMELLYLPIPPQTRNAVKGFIDMFVDRTGRAIGAVLLLVFTTVWALSISLLSLVAAALVLAWIVMSLVVKREYLHSFRAALEKKTIEPEALQLRRLDCATMRSLFAQLGSNDDREVLYALDLLSHTSPGDWRDQLNLLVHHQSGAIRARTIAVLAGWNDPSLARNEFVQHPDYETARIAAASALRLSWSGSGKEIRLLSQLLNDASADVARQAIVTAGMVGYLDAIPHLIEKLADKRLRSEARDALLRFGDVVIPELVRRLADGAEPYAVRRRIPKTLALTGKQQAADALSSQLHRLDFHLDYAVIRALNRLRINSPDVEIGAERVTEAIGREQQEYDRLRSVRLWLHHNPMPLRVYPLLMRALAERLSHRLERIFRLVALIYSPHDIYSVYYNCQVRPALRASAIEFLDNILDPEMKARVVPLLEESCQPDQDLNAKPPVHFISHAAILRVLSASDDPWLKVIANECEKELGEIRNERTGRLVVADR